MENLIIDEQLRKMQLLTFASWKRCKWGHKSQLFAAIEGKLLKSNEDINRALKLLESGVNIMFVPWGEK